MVPGFSVTISITPGIRVLAYKLFQRVNFSFGETGTTGSRLYLPGKYSVQFLKNSLDILNMFKPSLSAGGQWAG